MKCEVNDFMAILFCGISSVFRSRKLWKGRRVVVIDNCCGKLLNSSSFKIVVITKQDTTIIIVWIFVAQIK